MGIFRKSHFQTYNIDIGRGGPIFWFFLFFFFIARAPSRFTPNPRTYTDANRQTKHLRTDLRPQTFENLKNVLLGGTTICFSRREIFLSNSIFEKRPFTRQNMESEMAMDLCIDEKDEERESEAQSVVRAKKRAPRQPPIPPSHRKGYKTKYLT